MNKTELKILIEELRRTIKVIEYACGCAERFDSFKIFSRLSRIKIDDNENTGFETYLSMINLLVALAELEEGEK